jgi:hypothetical protein
MMTIQVPNVTNGEQIVVYVSSGTVGPGSYNLGLNFSATPFACAQTAGTLTPAAPATAGILQVVQAQVMHFMLSGNTVDSSTTTSLEMLVTNSQGQLVARLSVAAGYGSSLDVLLAPDTYTIMIEAASTNGTSIAPINFGLIAYVVSNPIGVTPIDPTSTTVTTSMPILTDAAPTTTTTVSTMPTSTGTSTTPGTTTTTTTITMPSTSTGTTGTPMPSGTPTTTTDPNASITQVITTTVTTTPTTTTTTSITTGTIFTLQTTPTGGIILN